MMKFEDITFYVTIGIAIINITGALRKVAKIKKEEPLYKIYEEILLQRILILYRLPLIRLMFFCGDSRIVFGKFIFDILKKSSLFFSFNSLLMSLF